MSTPKHDSGKTVAKRNDPQLAAYILGFEDAIRNAPVQTFGGRLLSVLGFEMALITKLVLTGNTAAIEAGFKAFVKELKHAQSWLEHGVD